jgi:hypothetical protein
MSVSRPRLRAPFDDRYNLPGLHYWSRLVSTARRPNQEKKA